MTFLSSDERDLAVIGACFGLIRIGILLLQILFRCILGMEVVKIVFDGRLSEFCRRSNGPRIDSIWFTDIGRAGDWKEIGRYGCFTMENTASSFTLDNGPNVEILSASLKSGFVCGVCACWAIYIFKPSLPILLVNSLTVGCLSCWISDAYDKIPLSTGTAAMPYDSGAMRVSRAMNVGDSFRLGTRFDSCVLEFGCILCGTICSIMSSLLKWC